MLRSIDPFSQELITEYSALSSEEVKGCLSNSWEAFLTYKKTSFKERSSLLLRIAEKLKTSEEEYAQLMTREMGKPIVQARGEIQKCGWLCTYYAENGADFLESRSVVTDASRSYVRYDPLGPILGVMPWNFPFWQVLRFAIPTLMAGNTVLLKHASNVSGCAIVLEDLFQSAGFPEKIFQTLLLPGSRVEEVLSHTNCRGVSLTGSGAAGSSVGALAGRYIKPSLLELGGSNPFIVLKDADLEFTLHRAVQARIQNNGQSCIAAKRFLIHQNLYDEFAERLQKAFERLKMGNPMDEETEVGPLARIDLAEELEKQVRESIQQGAMLLSGGTRCEAFYEPTVLSNVTADMPVWREETFGPVAALMAFDSDEDLFAKARHKEFGLGASIFTGDANNAESMVQYFDEGAVFINEMVKSDPRLPFGGVKASGYGRELSKEGIRSFVNAKTIYVNNESASERK